MIQIEDKKNCCGCGACMNICPRQCTTMCADKEGFLYPIVDTTNCVQCGWCEKVCPVLQVEQEKPFEQEAYIVQIMNEQIRRESTSGGAFTAIAQYVIEKGGVVYGAAYDVEFQVEHTHAYTLGELKKFRNSKYVQSNTKNSFREVTVQLKSGRLVCYSGTPCQIEGLKRFLGKEYENLVTVDIMCYAVPSPLIWNKYLEMQKKNLGTDFSNILFRDKHYGYKYSTMTFKDVSGNDLYNVGIDTDPMLRAFFSAICDRPSCYKCVFKKRYRVSDFTIWDCNSVYDFDKCMDDDKGTTRMLIHSSKGQMIFDQIKGNLKYAKFHPDQLTAGVKEMFSSVSENSFEDANHKSGIELFNIYFPVNIKTRIKRYLRLFLISTNMYSWAKKMFKEIKVKMSC
jgi:ferredoxin